MDQGAEIFDKMVKGCLPVYGRHEWKKQMKRPLGNDQKGPDQLPTNHQG